MPGKGNTKHTAAATPRPYQSRKQLNPVGTMAAPPSDKPTSASARRPLCHSCNWRGPWPRRSPNPPLKKLAPAA
eukprot:3177250-Alexandrium_andersonii.AAC.1